MNGRLAGGCLAWAVVAPIGAIPSTAHAAERYFYCKATSEEPGVHYFHWDVHVEDIGRTRRLPNSELSRAFRRYLRNVEGVERPKARCGYNAASYGEAERERDEKIQKYERRGDSVIMVDWYPDP